MMGMNVHCKDCLRRQARTTLPDMDHILAWVSQRLLVFRRLCRLLHVAPTEIFPAGSAFLRRLYSHRWQSRPSPLPFPSLSSLTDADLVRPVSRYPVDPKATENGTTVGSILTVLQNQVSRLHSVDICVQSCSR